MEMKPLLISKVNTAGQILLAGAVLALHGLEMPLTGAYWTGVAAVALLTAASGALYMRDWVRHMANGNNRGASP
jgi:cardiolipin synthase